MQLSYTAIFKMSGHWHSWSFPNEEALVLVAGVVVEVVGSAEASMSEHLSAVVKFGSMFG